MDEKDMDLEEEIEETEEETASDADGALDEEDTDYDDEDGVMIPEDDDETDEEDDTDGDPEEDTEEEAEEDADTASDADEGADKPDADAETKEDDGATLKRKMSEFERQARDTLKKYGYEGDDILKGLAQIAADSEGKDLSDYLKEQAAARQAEEAKAVAFEEIAKKDLAELQGFFPETLAYKHVKDMPQDVLVRFAQLRNMGLSAKEAYAAANPTARTNTGTPKKQSNGKEHLQSRVPKGASGTNVTVPKETVREWAEDLGVSEKEAREIYLKTL